MSESAALNFLAGTTDYGDASAIRRIAAYIDAATGSGSPEGAVTGNVGDLYTDSTNGHLYIKGSGVGTNTGWVQLESATSGSGDVNGPGSATDNALVRFDGTTGKVVQNSGITVDDSGNITSDVTIGKADATLTVGSGSGGGIHVVKGAAGQSRQVRLLTGTSRRWDLGANTTAEGGSSAGSDFVLTSHGDGGTQTAVVMATRSTGKVTLGAVGATAGLELGSSGPRVMSGTGSPEGVVTAPVGSQWIGTAATTGAIKWIKATGTGNTGWVVEYGDTGTRNLTAYWSPSGITVNALSIRRVNETIYIQGDVTLDTAYGTNTIGTSWPSGFTPAAVITTALDDLVVDSTGAVPAVLLLRSNLFGIYKSSAPANGSRWRFIKTWRTTDAWPSSLPGSAA